jgi:hypothetical protein
MYPDVLYLKPTGTSILFIFSSKLCLCVCTYEIYVSAETAVLVPGGFSALLLGAFFRPRLDPRSGAKEEKPKNSPCPRAKLGTLFYPNC